MAAALPWRVEGQEALRWGQYHLGKPLLCQPALPQPSCALGAGGCAALPGPWLRLSPAGHCADGFSTGASHAQGAISPGIQASPHPARSAVREGRVSCSQTLCPCVARRGRVLTPLGRHQYPVCWDSSCLPFLPSPHGLRWEAGIRGQEGEAKNSSEPRGGAGQHPAAPPGRRLSKGEGGPLVVFLLSPPTLPLPASLSVRWALGRAWSRRQYSPVPGVRVGSQCKGPGLGGWLGAQGQGIIVCGPRAIERPPYPCSNLL